jgi:ubiquinone/menaquinone biosynthesis C-methylase UbiE
MPFSDASFDAVVCVGSVINYTNAALLIREIRRVLRPKGWLLLEFERSESVLFLGHAPYRKNYWPVKTKYKGASHVIWIYSERYMREVLAWNGFRIASQHRYHTLTAAAFRVTKSLSLSALLAALDPMASWAKLDSQLASNIVLCCN